MAQSAIDLPKEKEKLPEPVKPAGPKPIAMRANTLKT